MNSSVAVVANIFQAGAILLGVPALSGLLLGGLARFVRRGPRGSSADAFPKNPDAILFLLGGLTRALEGIAAVFGAMGKFLLRGLVLVSCVVLPFAVVLFFTGRGLHAGEGWARWVGFGMLALVTLVSAFGVLALRKTPRGFALLLAAAAGYGAWVLWTAKS